MYGRSVISLVQVPRLALRKPLRTSLFYRGLLGGLVGLALCGSGCAGQLKGAMVEHAHSTRSVADTIKKALESVKCDAAAASCPIAVSVIEDQVKALQDGANKLDASGR